MNVTAEIIAIGNELLQGDVLDTNSHWLCRTLTGLGAVVQRVTQVRDERATIAKAVQQVLERRVGLLLTSGGLGPTDDDLTLEALAAALGRPLVEDTQAREWVAATYRRLAAQGYVPSAESTPARLKMARLPEGARPLPNRLGAAPGVYLLAGQTHIICLPGVPAELKDILSHASSTLLADLLGAGAYVYWQASIQTGDESLLAPILHAVVAAHPDVYLKSRARGFGPEARFLVTLAARGCDQAEALARIEAAWASLQAALAAAKLAVLSLDRG